MTTTTKNAPRLVGVGLVMLIAAACGGSGSSTKDDVAKAVRGYSQAFLSADATTAYGMLSDRCKSRVALTEFTAFVGLAKATYGPQAIRTLTVDDATASTAHVTYTYANGKLNQTRQSWVKQSGSWRWDGC